MFYISIKKCVFHLFSVSSWIKNKNEKFGTHMLDDKLLNSQALLNREFIFRVFLKKEILRTIDRTNCQQFQQSQ
jgi:hypothetical protein